MPWQSTSWSNSIRRYWFDLTGKVLKQNGQVVARPAAGQHLTRPSGKNRSSWLSFDRRCLTWAGYVFGQQRLRLCFDIPARCCKSRHTHTCALGRLRPSGGGVPLCVPPNNRQLLNGNIRLFWHSARNVPVFFHSLLFQGIHRIVVQKTWHRYAINSESGVIWVKHLFLSDPSPIIGNACHSLTN